MMYRKKFIPGANLRKIIKHPNHPRIDNEEKPKPQYEDGSGFLAEMRQLDFAADEVLKSHAPTTS